MSLLLELLETVFGGIADLLCLGCSQKQCLGVYFIAAAAVSVIASALAVVYVEMPPIGLAFTLPIATVFLVAGAYCLRADG